MRKFLLKDPLQIDQRCFLESKRIIPFKPIASTNHTRSQYRGIHTERVGQLTCRGTVHVLVFAFLN